MVEAYFVFPKDLIPSGHDISAHITYSQIFIDALKQGQFPVRWVEHVWPGHSQPLFNFYQVGFYYFVSLVNVFTGSIVESIKFSVLFFWLLGALFMYLWVKRFGILPATVSSLIFVFSPYLILDIFVRSAFPEFTAISLTAGIFWALDRQRFYLLSILIGLTIITHLPTFVIFSPVIAGYLLIDRKKLIPTAFSFLLGILLSSFYLLPAIFEQQFINIDNLRSGNFDFHKHFVYPQQLITYVWGYGGSDEGLNDNMSFQVGIVQWFILGSALLASFIIRHSKFIILFLLSSIFALLMMIETSSPVWETFKFLQFLQFPWRYFMIISLSTAVLAGLLLSLVRSKIAASIILILSSIFVLYLYSSYLTPEVWLPKDYYSGENLKVRGYFEPGYNPLGVEKVPTEEIPRYQSDQETTTQELLLKNNHLSLKTNSTKPFLLTINSHFFPGWKAYIDGNKTEIAPSKEYWFLQIAVPEGRHIVEAKLTDTPIRKAGNLISLGTILLIILLSYPKKPKNCFFFVASVSSRINSYRRKLSSFPPSFDS